MNIASDFANLVEFATHIVELNFPDKMTERTYYNLSRRERRLRYSAFSFKMRWIIMRVVHDSHKRMIIRLSLLRCTARRRSIPFPRIPFCQLNHFEHPDGVPGDRRVRFFIACLAEAAGSPVLKLYVPGRYRCSFDPCSSFSTTHFLFNFCSTIHNHIRYAADNSVAGCLCSRPFRAGTPNTTARLQKQYCRKST